jgi:hypothetical protein
MYPNLRRARVRVSDDFVLQDLTTETRDLLVSVLGVGASQLCVSHVVRNKSSRHNFSLACIPEMGSRFHLQHMHAWTEWDSRK